MAIITLTTDFGMKAHFVGAVKGALLSEIKDANIVDISHNISPFNVMEAAYVIQNAFSSFPIGSIHVIGVDSELNPENSHIAMVLNGHYFVCANNGILSMICNDITPDQIVEVNIHDKIVGNFPVLDIFVKVAAHIARGGTLEVIGKPIDEVKPIKNITPFVGSDNNQLIGNVIFIDRYDNVITNIKKPFFETIQKGRRFEISARNHKFKTIHKHYSDIVDFRIPIDKRNDEGRGLVVFNSSDYLEIAMYKSNKATVGGASTLMGLEMMDSVTISFFDD
ncbi:MAG: SAM hydrolase/SAM-dependent halogenase family protein [Flavobacteriaceae bacterium]|jgi:S-adenosylmethionine hydrolase|nr:SAM-dependent chlorinase/fluorinase [Flavobacteriaceae bacterium]